MEPKPKLYRVVMRDLGAPLCGASGPNPRGQKKVDFEALSDARHCAEQERKNWKTVVVQEGTDKTGEFNEVERYQDGRKYEAKRDER